MIGPPEVPKEVTDGLKRRNRRIILGTLIVLVILVWGIVIKQKLEKAEEDSEPFPPERWTIVEPPRGDR